MSDLFRSKIIPSGKCCSDKRKSETYDPLPWSDYFNYKEDLETDVGTFRIYRRGVEGPILFFLHGGGFSALSWSVLSKAITEEVKCQCLAMDIRGHGDTVTTDDGDLSSDTLAKDVGRIVMTMYPTEAPPIILIGHSMGGAVAIHSAIKSVVPSLVGLVVIDVVEGSALDALYSMNNYLHSRPSGFRSFHQAIEWSIKTGHIKNVESARISFPGQLKRTSSSMPATRDVDSFIKMSALTNVVDDRPENKDVIAEVDEDADESISNQNHKDIHHLHTKHDNDRNVKENTKQKDQYYSWRIDLAKTEPYWRGWFKGMSKMFLSISQPKFLILAGIDRMDKELTIGQMQGKFQMQVIPNAGHAVHEDVPEKVADCLANFLVRNRFTEAKVSCDKYGPQFSR